jgi:Tfp pilus assembly PilM family ATPase/Tfp pilus assembly protein PilN
MPSFSVIRRKRGPVTGLDVTADRIAVAGLDASGSLQTAVRPLPPGLVHDGEVRDEGALAGELRAMFEEHTLSRSVRIGLASPRIVVRRLELPAVLRGSELDTAVRFQAADVLPGALDEVVLDHRALEPEGDKRRIVLAAARRDIVERWRDAIDLAGLRLEGVDLAGFALARALATEIDPDATRATVLVHLGDVETMAIVERGACVFARSTGSGAGAEPAAEARSALDFHAGTPGALPLARVVLSGASDDWDATEAAFQQQLGAPVFRDRSEGAARDDLLLATGLARVDAGQVAVDLRAAASGERARRADPAARQRRILAPALAGAVALLAGASALYVQASNTASARADKATRVEAQATTVEQQAAALVPYEKLAAARLAREGAVRQVAGSRFDWSSALRDIARLTPADVDLTSLRATVAPGVSLGGSGTGGGGAGGASLRGARAAPAIELTGCAASHPGVSRMIGRMGRVGGVTLVSLSNSARLTKAAGGSGAGAGDCRNGDQRRSLFSMVLFFEKATPILPPDAGAAAAPTPATAAPGSTTAGSTTPGSTTPSSSTATTPSTTPSAPTTTTGSAP